MILIIEGADLVGKSTLAKRFASTKGWSIAKIRWALRGDPEIETRAMAATTFEILRNAQPNIIFDRIYFSWWAYGESLGHDISYMPEIIADFSVVQDARLIVLTDSDEELRRRFERKPDLYFSLDVILAANARFPSLLPLLPEHLRSLHIDTTYTNPDQVFAQADAFIRS